MSLCDVLLDLYIEMSLCDDLFCKLKTEYLLREKMITVYSISIARAASVLNTSQSEIRKMLALEILNRTVNSIGLYSVRIDLSLEREMKRRNSRTTIEELYRESRGSYLSAIKIFPSLLQKSENPILKNQENQKIEPQERRSSRPELRVQKEILEIKKKPLFHGKKEEIIPIFPQSKDRKFLELYLDSFFPEIS